MSAFEDCERTLAAASQALDSARSQFDSVCESASFAHIARWKKSNITKTRDIALLTTALDGVKRTGVVGEGEDIVVHYMEAFLDDIADVRTQLTEAASEYNTAKTALDALRRSLVDNMVHNNAAVEDNVADKGVMGPTDHPHHDHNSNEGLHKCVQLLETLLIRQQLFETKVEQRLEQFKQDMETQFLPAGRCARGHIFSVLAYGDHGYTYKCHGCGSNLGHFIRYCFYCREHFCVRCKV